MIRTIYVNADRTYKATHFNGISLTIRNSPPWEGTKGWGDDLEKIEFFHSKRGERKFPSVKRPLK
ncbi:MAG: hypothetical protein LBP62_01935 [Clostridiales bacterium]|nr:hypothetical protein [Clostridiales bacterium]